MRIGIARVLVVVAAGLWLAGCTTSNKFSDLFDSKTPGTEASALAPSSENETTGVLPQNAMASAEPGLLGSEAIKWNFTKFLVDREGNVVRRYAPNDTPESLAGDIEKVL